MTCGIYKLTFGSTISYVGKSENISRRYNSHLLYLSKGLGTKKFLAAFIQYGTPEISILEECTISELNAKEKHWIKELNTVIKGLNSTEGGDGASSGELNSNAKYSNEDIEECFDYIITNPTVSLKEVSNILNISYATVQNIAGGRLYLWIQERRPEDFAKLLLIKGTRGISSQRKEIHVNILDPFGTVHLVESIAEFADRFNLDRGNLGKVIRKQAKSTKGWRLVD